MTKPLTELFEERVAYARETLLEAEKIAYRKNSRDYAESCFQFGGDPELRDPWFHGVGFDCGSEKEAERRKPIDLATKKLIEALECYAKGLSDLEPKPEKAHLYAKDFDMNSVEWRQRSMSDYWSGKLARQALAEFRASLEDGE